MQAERNWFCFNLILFNFRSQKVEFSNFWVRAKVLVHWVLFWVYRIIVFLFLGFIIYLVCLIVKISGV
jgi:hypothetical protein